MIYKYLFYIKIINLIKLFLYFTAIKIFHSFTISNSEKIILFKILLLTKSYVFYRCLNHRIF